MKLQLIYTMQNGACKILGGLHWLKAVNKLKALSKRKIEAKLLSNGELMGMSWCNEDKWTWFYDNDIKS